MGKWNAETVLSPRGLADAVTALTTTIKAAKTGVAT